jgi:hypothetical protein
LLLLAPWQLHRLCRALLDDLRLNCVCGKHRCVLSWRLQLLLLLLLLWLLARLQVMLLLLLHQPCLCLWGACQHLLYHRINGTQPLLLLLLLLLLLAQQQRQLWLCSPMWLLLCWLLLLLLLLQ